jgi:hypothetical protein
MMLLDFLEKLGLLCLYRMFMKMVIPPFEMFLVVRRVEAVRVASSPRL